MFQINLNSDLKEEPDSGFPQKKIIANSGFSRTLFQIFKDVCFINSRTFPVLFKIY